MSAFPFLLLLLDCRLLQTNNRAPIVDQSTFSFQQIDLTFLFLELLLPPSFCYLSNTFSPSTTMMNTHVDSPSLASTTPPQRSTVPYRRSTPTHNINTVVPRAQKNNKSNKTSTTSVTYGRDWYTQTREATSRRTVREEIEYRREANRIANNGRERKDLYTDNWDGDQYKGSSFNILTVLAVISVLVPVLGLVFAYQTYGVLWG